MKLLAVLAILAAGYVLLAWTAWKMDIRACLRRTMPMTNSKRERR